MLLTGVVSTSRYQRWLSNHIALVEAKHLPLRAGGSGPPRSVSTARAIGSQSRDDPILANPTVGHYQNQFSGTDESRRQPTEIEMTYRSIEHPGTVLQPFQRGASRAPGCLDGDRGRAINKAAVSTKTRRRAAETSGRGLPRPLPAAVRQRVWAFASRLRQWELALFYLGDSGAVAICLYLVACLASSPVCARLRASFVSRASSYGWHPISGTIRKSAHE